MEVSINRQRELRKRDRPRSVAAASNGGSTPGTAWNGSALQRVTASNSTFSSIFVNGQGSADLDVVAQASASGGKYTAVHLNGISAGGCNYHALIIPPA